jgi:hypothetical protein
LRARVGGGVEGPGISDTCICRHKFEAIFDKFLDSKAFF